MSPVYRSDLIPRWVWVLIIVSLLLVLVEAFSVAFARGGGRTSTIGQPVKVGNPQDFLKQPPTQPVTTPSPPATATPTTPPTAQPGTGVTPTTPPTTEQQPASPSGPQTSFTFGGKTWQLSGSNPVQINVETTGQYTDGSIIYHRAGEQPPYSALYIETAPNSGEFYKYTPSG